MLFDHRGLRPGVEVSDAVTVVRMKVSAAGLCILIVSVAAAWAEPPKEPETRAQAIAILVGAESYDEESVGLAGAKSTTFRAYEWLRENVAVEEWAELTAHESPVVRCYAVRALADAKDPERLRKAVFEGIRDTARVRHFQGCIMGEAHVGDVIVRIGLAGFDEETRAELRDAMLASDVPLLERERMLWTGAFGDKHVDRVLELARDGNLHALRGLATRKHPEASKIIVKILGGAKTEGGDEDDEVCLHSAVMSTVGWPDPRFWKGLDRMRERAAKELNHNWVRDYMKAVAGYENEAAARVLHQLLDVNRGAEWKQRLTAEKVFKALDGHRVESFETLRRRLAITWSLRDEASGK